MHGMVEMAGCASCTCMVVGSLIMVVALFMNHKLEIFVYICYGIGILLVWIEALIQAWSSCCQDSWVLSEIEIE